MYAAAVLRSGKAADTERRDATTSDAVAAAGYANEDAEISATAPALRFNWNDWLPYLEDQDIPDEQKRELIETLWSIVVSFVDIGWQVTPKAETCGKALDLKAILTAAAQGNGKEDE